MKFTKRYITIIFTLTTLVSQAQLLPEKGVPHLKNYPPSQFQNKGKIWDIETSPNGLVYMASDKGLLEFDGETWKSFEGSKGITRSVLCINDSLIYTGSDLDFGIWTKSGFNDFNYTSLYPFKEEVQDGVEEFWNVHQSNDRIVFVSSQHIYLYKNNQVTQVKAPINISKSFVFKDTLFFADDKSSLYYFDKIDFKLRIKLSRHTNVSIAGLFDNDGKTYIVSKSSGLFSISDGAISTVTNSLSLKLKESKVFSFEHIADSYLAFGTILKGIIITDLEGNVIHSINKIKGLLSNTILSLHYSQSGKLWFGLDYGVSSLFLYNSITYFYDYRGDFGTAICAKRVNDDFYLGTNQGLYHTSWKSLDDNNEFTNFNLVPGTEGQVWSLLSYDDQLFIGHDRGLFSLKDSKLTHINKHDGVWTIILHNGQLLAGTYNGISIYKKSNAKWNFNKKLDLISGSCNQLIIPDNHTLWVNIPNYGVIKVTLDNSLNTRNQKIFLSNTFEGKDLSLVDFHDTIQVITDNKRYDYNHKSGEFILSNSKLSLAKPDNLLQGVYLSTSLCENYAFYPIYNGFAFKYLKEDFDLSNHINRPIIRKIEAYNNHFQQVINSGSEVPYKLHNVRIKFILPNQENVVYQYKLNDDDEWSNWVSKNTIDMVGMSAGSYNFQLRAEINKQISKPIIIPFIIKKPWARTLPAYITYILFVAFIVFFIFLWQKRLIKKEKAKMLLNEKKSIRELTKKHEETLAKIEQERIQQEYEQLKQQLRTKTIELANKSKESEDKNRLLISMQEKFVEMQENPKIAKLKLSEIRRLLNSYIKVEDRTFEIQMDELHQEFFKNIKDKYQNLSNNDLRLCAYIRIGLNSKEIAEILNIQPSSSYISRSRLRKKLNLNTEDDLYDFLNKF